MSLADKELHLCSCNGTMPLDAASLAKAGEKDRAREELKRLLSSTSSFPERAQAETLLKQL